MTTTIEITHHRDLLLPLDDEVRAWLTANGIDPGDRTDVSVGLRGDRVYFVDTAGAKPVRLPEADPWPAVTGPLPDSLATRAAQWIVASVEVDDGHYGACAELDESINGPTFAKLDRHLKRGLEQELAPDCITVDKSSTCSGKAAQVWTLRRDHVIKGKQYRAGETVDLCTRCVASMCSWPGVEFREIFESSAPRFEFVTV